MCIESLLGQKDIREIIVVDNGVSEDIKTIAYSFSNRLPVIYLTENKIGPSFARNLGIKAAKGDIITFLDSDCIVENKWTDNIIKSFIRHNNKVVQGVSKNILYTKSFFSILDKYQNDLYDQLRVMGETGIIDPKNLSIWRKDILINKLLFDENIPQYGEDLDFSIRLDPINFT
ncbi:MAG: Glycosyl transferase family 2, partial [Candidatus Gottesmanbacteria bacterium GW2011_GWC2_39_8]